MFKNRPRISGNTSHNDYDKDHDFVDLTVKTTKSTSESEKDEQQTKKQCHWNQGNHRCFYPLPWMLESSKGYTRLTTEKRCGRRDCACYKEKEET